MQCIGCAQSKLVLRCQPVHAAISHPLAPVQPHRGLVGLRKSSRHVAGLLQMPVRGEQLKRYAGPVDVMPTWTLDQIAGLAFGGLMVAFYFGAQYVDVYVAKKQRRELGLCEECGGLYNPSTCKQDKCPSKVKP